MKKIFKFGSLLGLAGGIVYKGKKVLMDDNFKHWKDEYSGIHITTEKFKYESADAFKREIEDFISDHQKNEQLSSVWVKLSAENIHLAHTLHQMGFDIHHTQDQSIIFNKWMNPSKPNKIPSYSTHYISCAPVLISDDNHLLVEKKGGKWGVPADTLKVVGMKIEEAAKDIIKQALTLKDNYEEDIKFQDTLLIREITKTSSGHPDILFALQFKCNQKYALANINDRQLEWIALDKLAIFIRDNQDHIHYPLHYLILERINTLYEQKKLDIPNPDSRKFDYSYKIFNSQNTIFPML